eukprot:CAMPEP_0115081656 /NCGR_PEP_ID=MMETSP0227-20121206/19412_1 /TAXON_ID=89957 /ORGANISM="Polarella glacialis, Strain CCMP 1383" /LENGTH=47 /DNA_ID= /DNA_START= /DNA_END= /DNA_ORIENTATION=
MMLPCCTASHGLDDGVWDGVRVGLAGGVLGLIEALILHVVRRTEPAD